MAEPIKQPAAADPDKKRELEATRKRLEKLGVAEDVAPQPDPVDDPNNVATAAGQGTKQPDQASVQPAAAGVSQAIRKPARD